MRFARLAATLLFSLIAYQGTAHAQNNKPIRSGNWYEDRASSSGSYTVNLNFAQGPSDKLLNITRVSCDVYTPLALVLAHVSLGGSTASGSGDLGRSQSIRGVSSPEISSSTRYYSIVTDSYLKLGPGRYPFIQFATAASGVGPTASNVVADCTIVGNLSDD
jgi:hypothetical protein